MSHLAPGEVGRSTAGLQVADATVPEGVHTARYDPKSLADWLQYLPHDVMVCEWSTVASFEQSAYPPRTKMLADHLASRRVDPDIPIAAFGLRTDFHALVHGTPNRENAAYQIQILNMQASQFPEP